MRTYHIYATIFGENIGIENIKFNFILKSSLCDLYENIYNSIRTHLNNEYYLKDKIEYEDIFILMDEFCKTSIYEYK